MKHTDGYDVMVIPKYTGYYIVICTQGLENRNHVLMKHSRGFFWCIYLGYLPIMPVNARDSAGTSRDKAGTSRDKAGTNRDKQGQTGTFPVCPCLSLLAVSVPVCPCLSLLVVVCQCLSLSVPVCTCMSLNFLYLHV